MPKIAPHFGPFWPIFDCAYAETGIFSLPVHFLPQNLKFSGAISYSSTNFGGTYEKICTCFERKTAFCNTKCQNLGDCRGGGKSATA